MTRDWIREAPTYWDEHKAAVFGDLDPNLFGIRAPRIGSPIGDEWWRVEEDGQVLGYGRLDESWGDAEILIVVSPLARRTGVGAFILGKLAAEADARHLNYVYNAVPARHPRSRDVTAWLTANGFTEAGNGEYRQAIQRSTPRRRGVPGSVRREEGGELVDADFRPGDQRGVLPDLEQPLLGREGGGRVPRHRVE